MKTAKRIRFVVWYSGDVQGVGFRVTAVAQLQGADVVGWVRNEPNGGVRLEAEGTREDVQRFLGRVRRVLANRIHDEVTEEREPLGQESNFSIRY